MRGNHKTIRTPGGICLGDPVPIGGRRGVHMTQGRKEEDLLPETIVECITGRPVKAILFEDEYDPPPKELNIQLPTLSR